MVEICGVKYVEGKSKSSGKDYKAYLLHYTEDGSSQGFDGYLTGDAFVSLDLLGGRKPHVGDRVELFYNKNVYLQSIEFAV